MCLFLSLFDGQDSKPGSGAQGAID